MWSTNEWIAALMWVVLLGPCLIHYLRKMGARSSTPAVSRNWEQDEPYPECFEDMNLEMEDDL